MSTTTDEKKHETKIGDRTVVLENFSTFKVIEMTVIVTEIMEEVPQLAEKLSTFTRDFQQQHSTELPRAAVELRYPPEQVALVSEKAWEAGGQKIVLPATPTAMDLFAHVIGDVMRVARERMLSLVGLIDCSNSELAEADEAGGNAVAELIASKARSMRHEDAGEVLDLLGAAVALVREQFADRGEALGPLGSMLGLGNPAPAPDADAPVPAVATVTPSTESGSTPATSTPSDAPTPGAGESPSTAHDSERHAASVT
jgi:hypothetical protein